MSIEHRLVDDTSAANLHTQHTEIWSRPTIIGAFMNESASPIGTITGAASRGHTVTNLEDIRTDSRQAQGMVPVDLGSR